MLAYCIITCALTFVKSLPERKQQLNNSGILNRKLENLAMQPATSSYDFSGLIDSEYLEVFPILLIYPLIKTNVPSDWGRGEGVYS